MFLCLTFVCILLSVICNKMEVMSPGACFIYLVQHHIRAAPLRVIQWYCTHTHTHLMVILSLWAHTLHLLCGWFKYYCQCSVSRRTVYIHFPTSFILVSRRLTTNGMGLQGEIIQGFVAGEFLRQLNNRIQISFFKNQKQTKVLERRAEMVCLSKAREREKREREKERDCV